MKGYTPGPWEVAEKHPGSVIAKHAQRVIAYCTRPEDEGHENETEKANAALIARAPEMADLLTETAEDFERWARLDWKPGLGQLERRAEKIRSLLALAGEGGSK